MPTPYAFDLRCEGASHKKQNKGCQDYSFHVQEDSYSAAIVCDGHGGSDYVRSDKGSQFAAESTNEMIQRFVNNQKVAEELKDPDKRENRLSELKTRIISVWKRKVKEYHSEHPFTEEEMAGLSEKARKRYFEENRVEVAYGTTLLAAVCAKDYWFGLHIGDGRCVYVNNDSKFREIPLDERCFLNATTSICDKDALTHFHHVFFEELPAAVFVGCDGVDGSFGSPEKLYNFYKTVLYSFATDAPKNAEAQLEEYLPRLSAAGSGDDVSIAAVLDLDAVKNLDMIHNYDPERAKAQKEENLRKEAERNEREREYLAKTADLKNEIRGLQTQFDARARELADVSDDISEATRKINHLTAQKVQDEQEYNEGQRKLNKMQQRLLELRDGLKRNQSQMKEAEYRKTKLDSKHSSLKRDFEKLKAELDGKKRALEQFEKDNRKWRQGEQDEDALKTREEKMRRRERELALKEEALERKEAEVEEKAEAVKDKETELLRKEEEMASQNLPSEQQPAQAEATPALAQQSPVPTYYPQQPNVPPYPTPYYSQQPPVPTYPSPYYPQQPTVPTYLPPYYPQQPQIPDVASTQSPSAVQSTQTAPVAQQSQPSYEQLKNAEAKLIADLRVQMDLKKDYEEQLKRENQNIMLYIEQANAQNSQQQKEQCLALAQQAQNKAQCAQQNAKQTDDTIQPLAQKLQVIQEQLRLYEQQTQTQSTP